MDLPTDPMGDVDDLMIDAARAGMDRRRSSFLSYFVHFAERTRWERAMKAAVRKGWVTTAYSNGAVHVVRLSHEARVTADRLREERKQLRRFARNFDGRWEAFVIEQLDASTYWDEIAAGVRANGRAAAHRNERRREPSQEREASSVTAIGGRSQITGRRVRHAS